MFRRSILKLHLKWPEWFSQTETRCCVWADTSVCFFCTLLSLELKWKHHKTFFIHGAKRLKWVEVGDSDISPSTAVSSEFWMERPHCRDVCTEACLTWVRSRHRRRNIWTSCLWGSVWCFHLEERSYPRALPGSETDTHTDRHTHFRQQKHVKRSASWRWCNILITIQVTEHKP